MLLLPETLIAENPAEKKLVFAYVRESIGNKKEAIETQIDAIRKAYPEQDYKVQFFQDLFKSGKNIERPQLQAMLSAIDEHPSLIVCTKIDRLARSLSDLLYLTKTFQEKGIEFKAIHQPMIDTSTSYGRMMLQLLGAFSEFEREIILERTRQGLQRAREMGVKFGRPKGKIRGGRFLNKYTVLEKYRKGLSARAISKDLECSITPILKIIRESV